MSQIPDSALRNLERLDAYLEEHLLQPGDVIRERYEIKAELGRGGFGAVYQARVLRGLRRGSLVALKVIHAEALARRSGRPVDFFYEFFRKEVDTTSRLQHPNIVTVLDGGLWRHSDGRRMPFLVMELLRGEPLARRLQRGALPVAEAVRIALEVTQALAYAHGQGVLHLDLSACNLFLTQSGHTKLLDFGLARAPADEDEPAGLRLSYAATPDHLPPEQQSRAARDPHSDLWALGVVLRQALTAEPPALTLASLPVDLPLPVRRVLERLLCRDRAGRFASAADVAAALRACQDELTRAPVYRRLRRGLLLVGAPALVLASLTITVLSLRALRRQQALSVLLAATSAPDATTATLLLRELPDPVPDDLHARLLGLVGVLSRRAPLLEARLGPGLHGARAARLPGGSWIYLTVGSGGVQALGSGESTPRTLAMGRARDAVVLPDALLLVLDDRAGLLPLPGGALPPADAALTPLPCDLQTRYGAARDLDGRWLALFGEPSDIGAGGIGLCLLSRRGLSVRRVALGQPILETVYAAAFSRDGRWLAVATRGGRVLRVGPLLVDNASRSEPPIEALNPPHAGAAFAVLVRDDGEVWSAGEDGHLLLWPPAMQPGPPRALLVPEQDRRHESDPDRLGPVPVRLLRESPDGRAVLSLSDSGPCLWPMDGAAPHCWPQKNAIAADFSPSGDLVLTAASDGSARLHAAALARPPRFDPPPPRASPCPEDTFLEGAGDPGQHGAPLRAAGFRPDGQTLFVADADGGLRLYRTTRPGAACLAMGGGYDLSLSADGRFLGYLIGERVFLLRLADQAILKVPLAGTHATRMKFSSDGTHFVVSTTEGRVLVLRSADLRLVLDLRAHQDSVRGARFSPDGQRLLTSGEDGRGFLLSLAGAELWRCQHSGVVTAGAFSPSGALAACAGTDGEVSVFLGDGGSLRLRHPAVPLRLLFLREDLLLVATEGEGLWAWRLPARPPEGGHPLTTAQATLVEQRAGATTVLALALSPGRDLLATGGSDGMLRLYRVGEGGIGALAFAGRLGDPVSSLAFDPTGRWLLATTVRAFLMPADLTTGPRQLMPGEHPADWRVSEALFTPEGEVLLFGEAQLRRLPTGPEALLGLLRQPTTLCLSPQQRATYLLESGAAAGRQAANCQTAQEPVRRAVLAE